MGQQSKWGKLAIYAIPLALTAVGFYYYDAHDTQARSEYTTASVTRGDLVQSITAVGQLAPLISVEVSSQISGLVSEVNVDFNSVVKKGQILARLDPSTYEQRLRQAEADLIAARASHALAALRAKRLRDLRSHDLIPQQDFDEAEAILEQTRAVLLTREASVENARVDLDRCTLRSPIDGVVIFKQVSVGTTVVSSLSAPTLFTIAQNLSTMRIVAPISEVDIRFARVGQRATFAIDAFADRIFNGHVTQIRNPYTPSEKLSVQQQSSIVSSFDAVIEVDNNDLSLRPSLTATVSIVVDERKDVLRIPNSALRVRIGDASTAAAVTSETGGSDKVATVFRIRGDETRNTAEPVSVRLGLSDNFSTEVTSGLFEGDTVITGVAEAEADAHRRGNSIF